jgi:hypothetical protein
LLKLWRATGAARKAYRIARRSLVERPDAYPLWLFAAETAALHLRKMPTAIRLVRRLCRSAEFSDDQKSFALNHLRGWAAEQGSDLSVQRIRNSYGPSPKPAPLKTIHRLRSQGRCQEAKGELLRLLRRDPENLAVAVLLVRVYAQDLHRRDKALQQINGLEKKPFTPAGVIDFLRNSLDEWSRVPSNRPSPNSLLPVGSPRFVGSAESSVSARAWPRVMKLLRRCPGGAARQDSGRGEARPAFTENLTPAIAKLVNEGLLGTAVDSLRTLIQQSPEDLTLRLQLAQVWMVNCGTLSAAESTINEIDGDSRFTDAQKAMAKGQLTRWRRQLAEHYPA